MDSRLFRNAALLTLALGLGYVVGSFAVAKDSGRSHLPLIQAPQAGEGSRFLTRKWNEGGGRFDLRHTYERQRKVPDQPEGIPPRAVLISLSKWHKTLETDRELGPPPWYRARFQAYGDLSHFGWRKPGRDILIPAGIDRSLRFHGQEDNPRVRADLSNLEEKSKANRAVAFQALLAASQGVEPVPNAAAYLVERGALHIFTKGKLGKGYESIQEREQQLLQLIASQMQALEAK